MFEGILEVDLDLGRALLIVLATSVLMLLLWVLIIVRLIHRATTGRDPEVLAAVRALPLPLAIGLDLLDLGLDVFGAPVAWMMVTRAAERLDRPELKRLRGLTVLESLVPGTQLIPVMTLTWIYAHRADGSLDGAQVIDGSARPVPPRRPPELPPRSGADEDVS